MVNIKKWLSTIITGLLILVLFGIIFVRLELVQLTETFILELIIVATLVSIIRFFWYSDGEDRALREQDLIDLKSTYANLVDTTITSQDDLEEFIDELNAWNRERWVLHKLKGKTEKTCENYDEIRQKLIEKSYKKVPLITSTQILTRSDKYQTVNATDYTKIKKITYQTLNLVFSVCSTVLLGMLAYKELLLNWANAFRYGTYVFNILWALVSSLLNGYKTSRNSTIDHISRLTMIVNRYQEWIQGGKQWHQQQAITNNSSNNTTLNKPE